MQLALGHNMGKSLLLASIFLFQFSDIAYAGWLDKIFGYGSYEECILDKMPSTNNKFAAIGPRFLNVDKKSHKQISEKIEFDSIDSIHGSCMFINKNCFKKIGCFDDKIFLYFEETEYCYRGKKYNYKSYQTNKSKVTSTGRSVDLSNDSEKISNVLIWHFIWSKFYYYKKHYTFFLAILIFIPIMIRILFRIIMFTLIKDIEKKEKYIERWSGLINSIKGNKSFKRVK